MTHPLLTRIANWIVGTPLGPPRITWTTDEMRWAWLSPDCPNEGAEVVGLKRGDHESTYMTGRFAACLQTWYSAEIDDAISRAKYLYEACVEPCGLFREERNWNGS